MPEAEAAMFRADHLSVDAREEGIVSQTWAIFDITRKHLEAEGLTLANIAHLTVFFTDLRDFPGYHRVRLSIFPHDPPPATVVEVSELLPTRETLLEIDVIASRQLPKNLMSTPD
ncbi:MAG: RidA family protein [Acidimicrobiales bacterium]